MATELLVPAITLSTPDHLSETCSQSVQLDSSNCMAFTASPESVHRVTEEVV